MVENQQGKLLRLMSQGTSAMPKAVDILAFLESELDAEIEDSDSKTGYGFEPAEPILIQLESLSIELVADGSELVLRRVDGSKDEFADLCDLIEEHYCP